MPTRAGKFEADFSQGNNLHLKSKPPRGSLNLRSLCRAESPVFVPGVTFPQSQGLPCHTFTATAAKRAPLPWNVSVLVRWPWALVTGWLVVLSPLLSEEGRGAPCPCSLNPISHTWAQGLCILSTGPMGRQSPPFPANVWAFSPSQTITNDIFSLVWHQRY